MAGLRAPTLRHVISGTPPYIRGQQRRWAQVHDIRYVATHQSNRVLDKYKDKLDRKAKQIGLRDVNELKEVYKDKIQTLKKKDAIPLPSVLTDSLPSPNISEASLRPPPAPRLPTSSIPQTTAVKTLSSYLDLPKVSSLPPKELEAIWRLRHINNPQSLCAVIPLSTYRTIEATAKQHPHFILPLPKEGQGAEIHFLQWTFPAENTVTVIFTHLAEYKLRGEFSQPHTTVTHHLEFAQDKGVVLLQGQVMEGRGVSVDEAKWLVMCLQKFYGQEGERDERKRLLEMFGRGDPGFRVEELVQEAERIG